MATTPEFKQYVLDCLSPLHPIRSKNMFGGVGIWSEDVDAMFALISSQDVIYFKVDASNKGDFVALEMPQFMTMPYYQLPDGILDDPEQLQTWIAKSVTVAKNAPKKKRKRKK